jgi:xanthine dehydrogenase accessory factor
MGVTADEIGRIHSPIGMNIGAASPAEIAVAVLAEIIAAFRSRGMAVETAEKAA